MSTTPTPAPSPDACREAFEAALRKRFPDVTCAKYSDGIYRAIETQQNWVGFQMAWNTRQPSAAEREALKERFAEILTPAINTKSPYAVFMIDALVQAVIEQKKGA